MLNIQTFKIEAEPRIIENRIKVLLTMANSDSPSHLLPLRMTSCVVRGFGRGSSDLGIPTANLDRDNLIVSRQGSSDDVPSFEDLPCGIYWGFARIEGEGNSVSSTEIYPTALSIGYNPTYGNGKSTAVVVACT